MFEARNKQRGNGEKKNGRDKDDEIMYYFPGLLLHEWMCTWIHLDTMIMLWSEWRASLVNRDWQIIYSLRNLPGACWFYQAAWPSNRGRCEPLEILHIYIYIYIWCTFSTLYSCMFTQQGCTTIWLNEF